MSQPSAKVKARFWSHVDRSGDCWVWTAARDKDGYGLFKLDGRMLRAHRFAYELAFGRLQAMALHHCDNPPCVRPSHLFEGTNSDDQRDCFRKGRRPVIVSPLWGLRGDAHPSTKLPDAGVLRVFELRAQGWKQQSIADVLGVSNQLVSCILRLEHRVPQ